MAPVSLSGLRIHVGIEWRAHGAMLDDVTVHGRGAGKPGHYLVGGELGAGPLLGGAVEHHDLDVDIVRTAVSFVLHYHL